MATIVTPQKNKIEYEYDKDIREYCIQKVTLSNGTVYDIPYVLAQSLETTLWTSLREDGTLSKEGLDTMDEEIEWYWLHYNYIKCPDDNPWKW